MISPAAIRKLALLLALTLVVTLGVGCTSRWTAPIKTPIATTKPSPTYASPSSGPGLASATERFNAIAQMLRRQPLRSGSDSLTIEVVYNSTEFFQALAATKAGPGKDAAAVFADYESQYKLNDNMAFSVYLDTHSVDLTSIKVDKLATLRDNTGRKVAASGWEENAGGDIHHRSGVLFFPRRDTSQWRYMELVLSGIAGVPERVFRWDLPIAYPQG